MNETYFCAGDTKRSAQLSAQIAASGAVAQRNEGFDSPAIALHGAPREDCFATRSVVRLSSAFGGLEEFGRLSYDVP